MIAEDKDVLLRAYAEIDNLKKRHVKELNDVRLFSIEGFAKEVVLVIDNLERALESSGKEGPLYAGVHATLESWYDVLSKFDIERVDATGQILNPHLHEAISKVPSALPRHTVVQQICAGYTLCGRLIRPAMVVVSSGDNTH